MPKGPIHRRARLKPSDASVEAMRADVRLLDHDPIDSVLRRKVVREFVASERSPLQISADFDPLPPEVVLMVGRVWRIVPAGRRIRHCDGYTAGAVVQCEQNLIWSWEAGELPR